MRSYLLCVAALLLAGCSSQVSQPAPEGGATIFEGARLITGDGGAAIENSAFVVVNNQFTQVGRRGEVQVPAGAARVDLAGKTVMPTMVDLHGHLGFQNVAEGTMSKETFTRENLIDHLERLAYHGVGAVVGIADLAILSADRLEQERLERCGVAKLGLREVVTHGHHPRFRREVKNRNRGNACR